MADASIVFRNEDMSASGKIYVDTMNGAGALAARFRNASYWVDVINSRDEVEHRWENGNPDWENSDVLYYHNGYDPYDFVRKGDGWWVAENRLRELSAMLAFAFDVGTGRKKSYDESCYLKLVAGPDWTLSRLVQEAKAVRGSAPTDTAETWRDHIMAWIQDSTKLYLRYRVEYAALLIKTGIALCGCRVPRLEVELAETDAFFVISFEEQKH